MNIAEKVIDAFGGLTEASKALGIPVTTVHSWKSSGKIPHWRHAEIINAAKRADVSHKLPPELLRAA